MDKKGIIKTFHLDPDYFFLHKKAIRHTGFGMDHDPNLLDNGFGLYSESELHEELGPLKSDFYRIALCLEGSIEVEIGLESFVHESQTLHFNIPDRLFGMKNHSSNFKSYYIFFTADFLEELLGEIKLQADYPFFNYLNPPFFKLDNSGFTRIKDIFLKISREINLALSDRSRAVKLLLNYLLIEAKRSYLGLGLDKEKGLDKNSHLLIRYKKLVAKHFISIRKVKDYAEKMAISTDHHQKIIKQETGKSPGTFIDEMLIMEIKALLRYSELTITEIANQLEFTDASHLAKFFKKYQSVSPTEYRKKFH